MSKNPVTELLNSGAAREVVVALYATLAGQYLGGKIHAKFGTLREIPLALGKRVTSHVSTACEDRWIVHVHENPDGAYHVSGEWMMVGEQFRCYSITCYRGGCDMASFEVPEDLQIQHALNYIGV